MEHERHINAIRSREMSHCSFNESLSEATGPPPSPRHAAKPQRSASPARRQSAAAVAAVRPAPPRKQLCQTLLDRALLHLR